MINHTTAHSPKNSRLQDLWSQREQILEPGVQIGPLSLPQRSSQAAPSVKEVVSGQRSDTYYSRLPFLDLHHYRDKGEKLGQPFNKEQGVSNNSSNATQAEERSLQSALSHGPCLGQKAGKVHPPSAKALCPRGWLWASLGCSGYSISLELRVSILVFAF